MKMKCTLISQLNGLRVLSYTLISFIFGCNNLIADESKNEMLIYQIKKNKNLIACVVGTAHLVTKPTRESKEFDYCVRHTNKFSFESIEKIDGEILLKKYESKVDTAKFSDLSLQTQEASLLAIKKMGINAEGIQYLKTLHPAGIFRFFMSSKYLNPTERLIGNIDVAYLAEAKKIGIPLTEFEGMNEFIEQEKAISIEQLNIWILKLAEIINSDEKYKLYQNQVNSWLDAWTVQPNVETALNATIKLNTNIIGLPLDATEVLVVNRNERMSQNIAKHLANHSNYLFFIGAAHMGGERGVVKLLESKGFVLERVQ